MKSVLSVFVGLVIVSAAIGAIVFVPWSVGQVYCAYGEPFFLSCYGSPKWMIGIILLLLSTVGVGIATHATWSIGKSAVDAAERKLSVITDRRRTRAETPAELRGAVDTPRSEDNGDAIESEARAFAEAALLTWTRRGCENDWHWAGVHGGGVTGTKERCDEWLSAKIKAAIEAAGKGTT